MPASITVKTPAATRSAAPRRRLALRVVHLPGDRRPPPHPLDDRPVQIGRAVDGAADLVLDDPSVSRVHARLTFEPGIDAYVLTDCGSSNGVHVGGVRLTSSRAVGVGDVIRLGEAVLVIAVAVALPDDDEDPLGLLGDGAAMTGLRRTIRRVAPSALPVLVVGATGTGKELVARALHARSGRRGPFVAVNCAALAPTMVENALFGHRKGAYTGAIADQPGAFVAADGGTLFLDEIGDMPIEAQPKLLRALENGEVTAIGASAPATVDVRVVAATHVALGPAIEARRFREDLLARLAGVTLTTPRLAERREDIAGLWTRLLPAEVRARPVAADVIEALSCHDWPRNVRELRRLAERMAVLHPDGARWELADLDVELVEDLDRRRRGEVAAPAAATDGGRARRGGDADDDDDDANDASDGDGGDDGDKVPMAKDALLALLTEHGGRVAEVARRARRNRKQIYRWMDAYGIARGTGRR